MFDKLCQCVSVRKAGGSVCVKLSACSKCSGVTRSFASHAAWQTDFGLCGWDDRSGGAVIEGIWLAVCGLRWVQLLCSCLQLPRLALRGETQTTMTRMTMSPGGSARETRNTVRGWHGPGSACLLCVSAHALASLRHFRTARTHAHAIRFVRRPQRRDVRVAHQARSRPNGLSFALARNQFRCVGRDALRFASCACVCAFVLACNRRGPSIRPLRT